MGMGSRIRFLVGVLEKPIYREQGWRLGQFAGLKGGMAKRGDGVLEGGGLMPQSTLCESR